MRLAPSISTVLARFGHETCLRYPVWILFGCIIRGSPTFYVGHDSPQRRINSWQQLATVGMRSLCLGHLCSDLHWWFRPIFRRRQGQPGQPGQRSLKPQRRTRQVQRRPPSFRSTLVLGALEPWSLGAAFSRHGLNETHRSGYRVCNIHATKHRKALFGKVFAFQLRHSAICALKWVFLRAASCSRKDRTAGLKLF